MRRSPVTAESIVVLCVLIAGNGTGHLNLVLRPSLRIAS